MFLQKPSSKFGIALCFSSCADMFSGVESVETLLTRCTSKTSWFGTVSACLSVTRHTFIVIELLITSFASPLKFIHILSTF